MRGELIFNLLLFSISIFLFYVAGTFRKFATYAKVGPEFWPRGILFLMIVLSGIVLAKQIAGFLKSRKAQTSEKSITQTESDPYRLFLVIVVSFGYAFCMGILGFLISTILFQLIFLYLLKVKRLVSIVFVTLVNTAMLYLLFIRVLNMLLPAGVGIFRTFSLLFY